MVSRGSHADCAFPLKYDRKSGLLTSPALCSLMERLSADGLISLSLNLSELPMERGCVSSRSLTMTSFCIHFGCVGGFFFSFFLFFFLKPTWQHQRFLPLMTTSYSSSLFLAGTRSVKGPNTAVPLCARQNASLGGMSLLPWVHLQVWLSLKFCRAEALLRALGLRSPKEALMDVSLMLQLDCQPVNLSL